MNIFVPHCSDLLTDHVPHGDGLIAHGFITHLARRGHRLYVAAEDVALRKRIHPNVTIYTFPRKQGKLISRLIYMYRVRVLLRELSADVTFDLIHQMNPVFAGLSLSLIGSGLPVVLGTYVPRWPKDLDVQSSPSLRQRVLAYGRDLIVSLQQRQADALLLSTPAASNRLPDMAAVRDRIHFLPHGIDTELFSPGRSNDSSSCTSSPRKPLSILFLANILERKGIFTLLDAFSAVANELADVQLRIVGDGPELSEAKRRAARLPCASRIDFAGKRERATTPALYRDCSVYCLPSFGEPHGMTLVEAMSCGCAVVSTDSGGPSHFVDAKGGRCVPAGDADALANELLGMLRDSELRAAMGRHNRWLVETTMSWERVTTKLECIYKTVLFRAKARQRPGGTLASANGIG